MGRCRYFCASNTFISYRSLVVQPHTPGRGQKKELYHRTSHFSDLFSTFNSSQLFPFPSWSSTLIFIFYFPLCLFSECVGYLKVWIIWGLELLSDYFCVPVLLKGYFNLYIWKHKFIPPPVLSKQENMKQLFRRFVFTSYHSFLM